MKRRHALVLVPALLAGVPAAARAAPLGNLDDALRWLDALAARPGARTTGAWPIGTVLAHLAQSIEMSLDGYPAPRSALFQHTVGTGAFAFFRWKGRMTHGLAEPIPGAPAIAPGTEQQAGAGRLREAIGRFQRHTGPLAPHFAYGPLTRADYAIAHALHIANHRDEIVEA